MDFIAELTLSDNLLLFRETFEAVPNAECIFEDIHYVTDQAGHTHYVLFWWTLGCPFDEFEHALERDPTVSEFQAVTELPNRRLYRVETKPFPPEQPLVFPVFRDFNITAIESRRDANGLHLRARFPSRDALHAFRDTGTDIADQVEVTRLYGVEPIASTTELLTEKQWDALALAFSRGYFESPSEATLRELAVVFGVTPQTLSSHIRAGVRKLVEQVVETTSLDSAPEGT